MVAALLKRAEWANQIGAYATVLAICDQIDKKAADLEYVYFLRGQALTKLDRHEEARTAFEKVLEINPDFPAIRFNLGNNAVHRGRYHEALNYYEE
jgi:superkiller protein 3